MFSEQIISAFTADTWDELSSTEYSALFARLQVIQSQIQTNMAMSQSMLIKMKRSLKLNPDRDNSSDIVANEKKILFEAYEIIQAIRQKMTGQVLTYRLYVTADDGSGARYIDVGAKNLESFLSFNSKEISIATGVIKKHIEDMPEDTPASFLNKKYSMVMSHFRHPDTGTGKDTLYLINSPPPPEKVYKGSTKTEVVFTRGHIIEALDAVVTKYANQLDYLENDANLLREFSARLKYDSVSGFKGGDNDMTQIKANAARLMRYTSIMNAIGKVLNIYGLIKNGGDTTKIRKEVRKMFADSGAKNTINEITDEIIDKFIDKILSELKT